MGAYTLPQNLAGHSVIVLTFDDAYTTTYDVAFQYMQPRGIVGTFYVHTNLVGTGSTYITSAKLFELQRNGWTVANHSKYHADWTTLTQVQIQNRINLAIADLQSWGITGNGLLHVAYPYGLYDADVLAAMAAVGGLTGRTGVNAYSTLPFATPYEIGVTAWMRATTTTLADMKTWVDGVIANDRLGICLAHQLVSSPTLATEWGIGDFQAFIDYLVQVQVPVATMDEVYRLQSGPVTVRTGDPVTTTPIKAPKLGNQNCALLGYGGLFSGPP